ncbi:hypothetical protein [Desulfohalovibrio reitneri]|uniref:hypothetical protein n=1 Tax=Desulfohalovibrio reitneri TaxID=1307759 RepID=UPI0004A74833|nr:hypothetical protein [Desulfohalovibrio reitneri]
MSVHEPPHQEHSRPPDPPQKRGNIRREALRSAERMALRNRSLAQDFGAWAKEMLARGAVPGDLETRAAELLQRVDALDSGGLQTTYE